LRQNLDENSKEKIKIGIKQLLHKFPFEGWSGSSRLLRRTDARRSADIISTVPCTKVLKHFFFKNAFILKFYHFAHCLIEGYNKTNTGV